MRQGEEEGHNLCRVPRSSFGTTLRTPQMTTIISREAHDKAKGLRLQRLRAVLLMLESIETTPDAYFYAAVEDVEDLALYTAGPNGTSEYFEEDKNYDETRSFTCNSQPVKNSLVSFFDIYTAKWKQSPQIRLGFYSTAPIGKESLTKGLKRLGVTLPDKPILALLLEHDFKYPNLLPAVRVILEDEYATQYAGKTPPGNLAALTNMSDDEFIGFLSRITWFFGEADEEVLRAEVLEAVRTSPLFSHLHEGKEEGILSLLMELLDSKQDLPDYANRFVHKSDVHLVFLRAISEVPEKLADPAWEMWKEMPGPQDYRSLSEKVLAVCPSYAQPKLARLARKASVSRLEARHAGRSFAALRYRVLTACEDLISTLSVMQHSNVSAEKIDTTLRELKRSCEEKVANLRSNYEYRLSNDSAIEGVILELFDSCFLAFDDQGSSDE